MDERIGVVGSLASSDLGLAELLLRAGLDAVVLRPASDGVADDLDPEVFPAVARRGIETFDGRLEFARALRKFTFVFTFTSALAFQLGRLFWLQGLASRLGWPRWINVCTGSDVTELAVADTRAGRLQRRSLRAAFVNVVPNYPWATRNLAQLGLHNVVVLPFPYRPFDEEPAEAPAREELVLLHPSHLDWGVTDPAPGRTSTKGNDRFLRAFARFVWDTPRQVRLILVDRGPDRNIARALVDELGIGDNVEWRAPMNHRELYSAIKDADVVVDQFTVGGLGGIAWESMALGRPVLTYLDPPSARLPFDEPPPVFNAYTEDELAIALHEIADREALAERSGAVRRWMRVRRYGPLDRYLYYMTLATGRHPLGPPTPGPVHTVTR